MNSNSLSAEFVDNDKDKVGERGGGSSGGCSGSFSGTGRENGGASNDFWNKLILEESLPYNQSGLLGLVMSHSDGRQSQTTPARSGRTPADKSVPCSAEIQYDEKSSDKSVGSGAKNENGEISTVGDNKKSSLSVERRPVAREGVAHYQCETQAAAGSVLGLVGNFESGVEMSAPDLDGRYGANDADGVLVHNPLSPRQMETLEQIVRSIVHAEIEHIEASWTHNPYMDFFSHHTSRAPPPPHCAKNVTACGPAERRCSADAEECAERQGEAEMHNRTAENYRNFVQQVAFDFRRSFFNEWARELRQHRPFMNESRVEAFEQMLREIDANHAREMEFQRCQFARRMNRMGLRVETLQRACIRSVQKCEQLHEHVKTLHSVLKVCILNPMFENGADSCAGKGGEQDARVHCRENDCRSGPRGTPVQHGNFDPQREFGKKSWPVNCRTAAAVGGEIEGAQTVDARAKTNSEAHNGLDRREQCKVHASEIMGAPGSVCLNTSRCSRERLREETDKSIGRGLREEVDLPSLPLSPSDEDDVEREMSFIDSLFISPPTSPCLDVTSRTSLSPPLLSPTSELISDPYAEPYAASPVSFLSNVAAESTGFEQRTVRKNSSAGATCASPAQASCISTANHLEPPAEIRTAVAILASGKTPGKASDLHSGSVLELNEISSALVSDSIADLNVEWQGSYLEMSSYLTGSETGLARRQTNESTGAGMRHFRAKRCENEQRKQRDCDDDDDGNNNNNNNINNNAVENKGAALGGKRYAGSNSCAWKRDKECVFVDKFCSPMDSVKEEEEANSASVIPRTPAESDRAGQNTKDPVGGVEHDESAISNGFKNHVKGVDGTNKKKKRAKKNRNSNSNNSNDENGDSNDDNDNDENGTNYETYKSYSNLAMAGDDVERFGDFLDFSDDKSVGEGRNPLIEAQNTRRSGESPTLPAEFESALEAKSMRTKPTNTPNTTTLTIRRTKTTTMKNKNLTPSGMLHRRTSPLGQHVWSADEHGGND